MVDSISYDTAKLVQVVPNLKVAQQFLLTRFFPGIVTADTEEVAIDVDVGKRRLAPFCSPLVEGRLVEQRRIQTDKFKPAYIKDKRAPDLRKPVRRMIGERIGGEMSAGEREMANLQFEMEDQVDMIDRRLEWMAASVLQTGTCLIQGEGFPATLVDFGRDSRLTIALSGTGVWGYAGNLTAAGLDPVPEKTITQAQALVLQISGAQCADIVFTNTAWELFKNGVNVQGAINVPKLADFGNRIQAGPQIARGGAYMGDWGMYRLWLYNDWFVDADDYEQPMIPDGWIVMCGPDMMGTRAFGLIMDPKFNYEPMPYAPKTWIQDDPAQRFIMMQSAPLVIPSRVNACIAIKVR